MTTSNPIADPGVYRTLQNSLGFRFANVDHLNQALTAAGADENNHEGNRRLALLGEKLTQTVIADNALLENVTRGDTGSRLTRFNNKSRRAEVAKMLGIDQYIRLCPLQSDLVPSPRTLSYAVSAIIGAVWLDSGRNFDAASTVLRHMSITERQGPCLAPSMLMVDGQTTHTVRSENQSLYDSRLTPPSTDDFVDLALLPADSPPDQTQSAAGSFVSSESIVVLNSSISEGNRGDLVSREQSPMDIESFSTIQDEESIVPIVDEWTQISDSLTSSTDDESMNLTTALSVVDTELTSPSVKSTNDDSVTKAPHFRNRCEIQEEIQHPTVPSRRRGPDSDTAVSERRPSKRRKIQQDLPRRMDKASFGDLVQSNVEKYSAVHPSRDEDRFISLIWNTQINQISHDKYGMALQALYYSLASPESLNSLQKVLRTYREGRLVVHPTHTPVSFPAAQMRFIEGCDDTVALMGLVKRYGVVKLWPSNGPFVVDNAESLLAQHGRRAGNPNHAAKSNQKRDMIRQYYPDITEDNLEYQQKEKELDSYRRLACRLKLLIDKFGVGALALMPTAECTSESGINLCVNNKKLLLISEDNFTKFVDLLDKYQGDLIRSYTRAIEPIIHNICHGTLDPTHRLVLEDVDPGFVLSFPKGSQELLDLLHVVEGN